MRVWIVTEKEGEAKLGPGHGDWKRRRLVHRRKKLSVAAAALWPDLADALRPEQRREQERTNGAVVVDVDTDSPIVFAGR